MGSRRAATHRRALAATRLSSLPAIRLSNLRAIRLSSLPAIRLSRAIRLNSREPEVIRRRVPTRPSHLLVDIRHSRPGDTNLRGRLVPQGRPGVPAKKSPVMIIAIVAAAIVLLAAVGGIIMVLTRGGEEQPDVTITPSQPVPPTEQPTPEPTGQPTTAEPQPSPTQSQPPTGGAIDLGNGIELKPAAGWQVKKTGENVAQLSDGKSVFLGQSLQITQSTNPGQLCDAWHQECRRGNVQRPVPGLEGHQRWHQQPQGSHMCCRSHRQRWAGHDKAVLVLAGFGTAERRCDGHRHGVLHAKHRHRTAEQGLHIDGQLNAGESGRRRLNAFALSLTDARTRLVSTRT